MSKGERLERLIESSTHKNVSQFSKAVGIPYTTIKSFIERDLNKASIDSVIKIAKALNVTVEYLIDEESIISIATLKHDYRFIPTSISAGLPSEVDSIVNVDTISLPDAMMGKWAGNNDICIMRTNGESMNNVIAHNSMIAIKKVELSSLDNGDIVVYSNEHEYSIKRFYNDTDGGRLIFRPDSTDSSFTDNIVTYENANDLKIHGKVVLYIVELD